jgi:hypothetical protein
MLQMGSFYSREDPNDPFVRVLVQTERIKRRYESMRCSEVKDEHLVFTTKYYLWKQENQTREPQATDCSESNYILK